jgi:hypothetical protein
MKNERKNIMTKITCKSGLTGERDYLRNPYDNNFEKFEEYCEIYNLHTRLGFNTPEDAWQANPLIESSVNPSDLRIVTPYMEYLEDIKGLKEEKHPMSEKEYLKSIK